MTPLKNLMRNENTSVGLTTLPVVVVCISHLSNFILMTYSKDCSDFGNCI